MDTVILFGSILGIVNSFILVIYALVTKKGNRKANIIFAFFILMLTLRISKSILLTFSDGLHDFLITIGLSGFAAIGPVYFFFVDAFTNSRFIFRWQQIIHLLPAIIITLLWVYIDDIRSDYFIWKIFYRSILLQYMIYLVLAIKNTRTSTIIYTGKKQLNIISAFLLSIWFAYLMNDVAKLPYISGAILYSVLIYFSLIIIVNKGYIINLSVPKYKNTGLSLSEKERILILLDELFEEERIYSDNIISLGKLAKRIRTTNHALSQVINESKNKTFFELLGYYRIKAAKELLKNSKTAKIADIAFDVGYNSLSAFNAAFKKETQTTPTNYRNGL